MLLRRMDRGTRNKRFEWEFNLAVCMYIAIYKSLGGFFVKKYYIVDVRVGNLRQKAQKVK